MVKGRFAIVGAGPAGMMLGYLLARAGQEVTVLERESVFSPQRISHCLGAGALRVFREVGLVDELLALLHNRINAWEIYYDGRRHSTTHLGRLARDYPFMVVIALGEVLNLIAVKAREFVDFDLRTGISLTGLLEEGGQVVGLKYEDQDGPHQLKVRLVVGADGQASSCRSLASIPLLDESDRAVFEVLQVRLPSLENWPETVGRTYLGPRSSVVWYADREGESQLSLTVPKGALPQGTLENARDIDSLREVLASRLPTPLATQVRRHLLQPEQVTREEVRPHRVRSWWRAGLLLIGDAAHTIVPYGGLGIGLALRDAVVAANHLARAIREEDGATPGVLAAIEAERLGEVLTVEKDQNRALRAIFQPTDPSRFLLRYGGMRRSLGALVGRTDRRLPRVSLEIDQTASG